jgi:hypothetical protein
VSSSLPSPPSDLPRKGFGSPTSMSSTASTKLPTACYPPMHPHHRLPSSKVSTQALLVDAEHLHVHLIHSASR